MENKTLESLLREAEHDEQLRAEAVKAFKEDKIAEFAAEHGLNVTKEEILNWKKESEGEVALDAFGSVSAACFSTSSEVRGLNDSLGICS